MTSRCCKIARRHGSAGGAARQLRRPAGRRVGLRHRQSARLRPLGHRRRRQLHRPQAVRREPRRLHPDRRRHQLRQQRRAADQRARRSDRDQLGDQLAREQHRVRRADQPGGRRSCRSSRRRGRVARGFIGVGLTDVTPALQRALSLSVSRGALVQDVTRRLAGRARRPAAPTTSSSMSRGATSSTNEELIRDISARQPGTRRAARHRARRPAPDASRSSSPSGRARDDADATASRTAAVRARQPRRRTIAARPDRARARSRRRRTARDSGVGRRASSCRASIPPVRRFRAAIRRGFVIMEINRQPVRIARRLSAHRGRGAAGRRARAFYVLRSDRVEATRR